MENEKTKTEKPAKTPGKFKKPVNSKKFEKYYVNYIEHPQEKKFFLSCFEKQDDYYIIRSDLTKGDVKKLKEIVKWVKKNHKGPVNFIPIAVVGAIVAAAIIFFTVYANPLLERLLENSLESIFEAKSDVDNFRLSLIRFRISLSAVTVANRDSPMTNLFQMGRTEIRLKPDAVLRGKVYIEEIRADTIRFGTQRTVSGALPGKPPREREERPKTDAPPLIDLKNFDVMALLNQEYDKLNSPKMYDEAINAYNEAVSRWKNQVESTKEKVEQVRTASAPVLNINVNSLRDAETITSTIQSVNNLVTAVQSTTDEAANIVNGIQNDISAALQLEQNARNALISDINHLKSYVDLGSGSAFAALEPFIRDVLSDKAEQYLDYGIIALNALEKLKALADAQPKNQKPKKEPKVVFKGRDVIFPSIAYPKFFLGILASDFTLDAWNWAFDLRDVSSNPDLTGKPVTLALGLTESGGTLQRQAGFKGSADFRTRTRERFSAAVNGKGFPVSLGDQLSRAGINGFTGNSDFSVSLAGLTDGGFSVGGDIGINSARLVNPIGTLAEAADTAIREADIISLGFQYIHHSDKNDEFKLTSNIAELITRAIRRTAEQYMQKAMDEIERAMRAKINEYIDGRFVNKDELDLLFRSARGDKAAVDQLKVALTNKQEELEKRLRDEASRRIEQVIPGQIQSIPSIPKLPGF